MFARPTPSIGLEPSVIPGISVGILRAGLPDIRFHNLRHTCASLLIREGASIKAVQHHLGHKSASITLDRYGHLFPEELDHLANRLDRVHAEAAVYPACTDAPVAGIGEGPGAGFASRD